MIINVCDKYRNSIKAGIGCIGIYTMFKTN